MCRRYRHDSLGGDGAERSSVRFQHHRLIDDVGESPGDDVAILRTQLCAVADPAELGCGNEGCAGTQKRIKHNVTGIGKRQDEKLDQRPRERSGVGTDGNELHLSAVFSRRYFE